MPYCKIRDRAQMSKTIIAARHFGLGGRESLETAVNIIIVEGLNHDVLRAFVYVYSPNLEPTSILMVDTSHNFPDFF